MAKPARRAVAGVGPDHARCGLWLRGRPPYLRATARRRNYRYTEPHGSVCAHPAASAQTGSLPWIGSGSSFAASRASGSTATTSFSTITRRGRARRCRATSVSRSREHSKPRVRSTRAKPRQAKLPSPFLADLTHTSCAGVAAVRHRPQGLRHHPHHRSSPSPTARPRPSVEAVAARATAHRVAADPGKRA
jgi:hypothetical protein